MTFSGTRDHVLILDFSQRFANRAETLLSHSAYRVLAPRSMSKAIEVFGRRRDQIALILAAGESRDLASAMQRVESHIRVFVFDHSAEVVSGEMDSRRGRWLSSLRTFP